MQTTCTPESITFTGQYGTPFVEEIRNVEEAVQDIRAGISRQIGKWQNAHAKSLVDADPALTDRAAQEIDGLFKLLRRLELAVS